MDRTFLLTSFVFKSFGLCALRLGLFKPTLNFQNRAGLVITNLLKTLRDQQLLTNETFPDLIHCFKTLWKLGMPRWGHMSITLCVKVLCDSFFLTRKLYLIGVWFGEYQTTNTKRHMFKRDWPTCSNWMNYSTLNNNEIYNWENLCIQFKESTKRHVQ